MAVSDTLRGYRTQFLYTVYRVLTSKDKEDEVFHPEGTEDLDVLADGKVIECIQVKNYLSGDVKYSDLQSAAHSTSFFRRGTNTLKSNPNAKLVLFSCHGIDKLDNLLIHDTGHDAIIEKVVSKLERFYHNFLDMENWWMLSSDLLESMQELLENDWIIKTALVKADDY